MLFHAIAGLCIPDIPACASVAATCFDFQHSTADRGKRRLLSQVRALQISVRRVCQLTLFAHVRANAHDSVSFFVAQACLGAVCRLSLNEKGIKALTRSLIKRCTLVPSRYSRYA